MPPGWNNIVGDSSASALDGLSNLTGAWFPSRRLLSSYAGDLWQLDGSDVAFVFNQSGDSGRDLAPLSLLPPTASTLNGRSAVLFDGVDDLFATDTGVMTNLLSASSGYLVCVFQITDAPLNDVTLYANNPIVTDFNDTNLGIFAKNNAELHAYNFDTGVDSAAFVFKPGVVYVMAWEHSGGNLRGRINGGAWETIASGDTDASFGNDRLGIFSNSGGRRTSGKWVGLVTFSTPPSDAEKDALEANLLALIGQQIAAVSDDFEDTDGTLIKNRVLSTGHVWRTTGAGHDIAEIVDGAYTSEDNTYAFLNYGRFGALVSRVEGSFSWLPVPGSLEDREDTCVTLIADAAVDSGNALQTMLHLELYADSWILKKRVSGGSFDGIADGLHTLAVDGTVYSVAMEISAGSVRLFLPDGTQQVVNDAAIRSTIVPVSGVWQVTAGITSYFKRWESVGMQ